MTTFAIPQTVGEAVPPLRQELRIEPGAPLVTGAPGWTLFDPLRHMFFELGRIEVSILSRWAAGSLGEARDDLIAQGLGAEEADRAISGVVDFSLRNSLTVRPLGDVVPAMMTHHRAARKAWWRWLVDHYLFVRVPLVKPAAFLGRTLSHVAPLWSRSSLVLFAMLGFVGLLLVSRQWDAFIGSFAYFFSLEGAIAYALALSLVKVAHELGHAYTATRFGCRVPAMGVSFLVMMPVLYTDTTAAWRLRSRRQRLMIDCAGVTVELMIASVATLLWVMLPEGTVRSAVFVLASTSWVMSLAINLNPFMRFDGYYVLADALGVPNLQPRAFALGRWRLRELLFDLGEAAPEELPQAMRRTMIVYAWATWAYRLVLFVGIALLVYYLFFKLLGIVLFLVEMVVFVARPIASELAFWWQRRKDIALRPRGRAWRWIGIGAVLVLVLPLNRHVSAPAVLNPIGAQPVVAGDPARIERVLVLNGQSVRPGTPLFTLSSPDLARDMAASRVRILQLEAQVNRAVSDALDLSNRAVLERELVAECDRLDGLERRNQRLVLRAPIAGQVIDLDPAMHPGRWLGGAETLAHVVTPGRYDVEAYVDETDVLRLDDGANARFVPDDPVQPSRRARLVERAASALQLLDRPILASTNGGTIAVNKDEGGRLRPRKALYRARLVSERSASAASVFTQSVPGRVVIDAEPRSILGGWLRVIMQVWRREASVTG